MSAEEKALARRAKDLEKQPASYRTRSKSPGWELISNRCRNRPSAT